jgi:hypothetical protein
MSRHLDNFSEQRKVSSNTSCHTSIIKLSVYLSQFTPVSDFRNFTEDKSSITPKLGLHFSLQETVITFRQKIIANDEAVLSVINHNPRKYRRNAKAVQRITPENESLPLTRLDKMAAAAIFRPFPITVVNLIVA